jgi:hypothetical protein
MNFNLTTNTSTTPLEYNRINSERGEDATIAAYGTFGGGTLTIEVSFDEGTTWIALKKSDGILLEITEAEVHNVFLSPCLMRFTLAGSTAADLNISFNY